MTYANPAPLGLFGFALTTWLLGMVNAGWFDDASLPMVLAMAFAFGGATQFVAGIVAAPRGDTFGFTAFCSFGAFWISWALFAAFYASHVPASFVGWYLFLWGVFTTVMWIGTFRANRALQFTFLCAIFTFYLLAAGEWTGIAVFHAAGGYAGLITGALAFYVASAQVIDESLGSDVLPLGLYQKPLVAGATLATALRAVKGVLAGGAPPAALPARRVPGSD
jgi:succinate-acetate transporter protein